MSITKAKELAVLSVLSAHDMHGYGISTSFGDTIAPLLGLKRPALYAMLERFRKLGWIEGRPESGSPYPDREVFSLTETGRQAVVDLGAELAKQPNLPISPLLAVLMGHDASGISLDTSTLRREREQALSSLQTLSGADHEQSRMLTLAQRLLETELEILREIG